MPCRVEGVFSRLLGRNARQTYVTPLMIYNNTAAHSAVSLQLCFFETMVIFEQAACWLALLVHQTRGGLCKAQQLRCVCLQDAGRTAENYHVSERTWAAAGATTSFFWARRPDLYTFFLCFERIRFDPQKQNTPVFLI